MAWQRRTPQPGEEPRGLIIVVVLAVLAPFLRQWIFGDDGSLVRFAWSYAVVYVPLTLLAFATRLVRFGWERVPEEAAH